MGTTQSAIVSIGVELVRAGAQIPERGTTGSTGYDLRACFEAGVETLEIGGDPVLVPTGLALEVPEGFDAQVRPRSGLTRQGIISAFGTIDSDYRGEVFVTMYVVGSRLSHIVENGDRIAQLVVAAVPDFSFTPRAELSITPRGARGHGSTGR